MAHLNLTRDEAAERAGLLEVHDYHVALDLSDQHAPESFGSTTVVRFGCRTPGAASFADLVGAEIESASLNGRPLDLTAYDGARLPLADLAGENELRVSARCRYSHTGEGMHRFVDPVDDRVYLYSQFEVPDARRVFTTFEQPDLKARFTFHVTAPEHWEVASTAATPEPERHGDGTATWRFAPTAVLSTYVTAVCAGEYAVVRDSYVGPHGEIPLGHFCRQSLREHFDTTEIVEITRQGFAFFEELFAMPYPFGKYDQLYVPEFNNGAMENVGCVTLRDEYVFTGGETSELYETRANTILHEMAHMWFGDLVTMRWWDDLWLNESFAEWAAHVAAERATAYPHAWTAFVNDRKNWAYRQDQLPTTHAIAADNHDLEAVEVNFDGITYAKGASTLKQLVAYVGEDAFTAGLRDYFARHAYGNTDLADLLAALEKTSGRDLGDWARRWLTTTGVNTLVPETEVDEQGRYARVRVRQTASAGNGVLRPHRIGIGLYDRGADGTLTRRQALEVDVDGEGVDVPGLVGVTRPDLLLLNDEDLSYVKIRFDERSLETVLADVGRVRDPLARSLCWGALWDLTRDAELSAHAFVDVVLRELPGESDPMALKQLPLYAQVAVDQLSAPALRPALRLHWDAGVRRALRAAEPGSAQQSALLKAYAGLPGKRKPPTSYSGAGRSDEAADVLLGLLDGSVELPGLPVGQGTRWSLLTALASMGRVDRARIAAELAGDATISGQERAAAALAVLPDAWAKRESWLAAAVRDDVPNETQRSIAYTFDVAGQEAVLAPFLDDYLRVATTIWEDKGVQLAKTMLEYMFPRALTDASTAEVVERWLATSPANPAAKRFVVEGLDDIRRALRAQAVDAAG